MKITLPSGVVVESDSAIEIDGMVIGPPARSVQGASSLADTVVAA